MIRGIGLTPRKTVIAGLYGRPPPSDGRPAHDRQRPANRRPPQPSPTIVQVAESTVLDRTKAATRSVDSYVREMIEGDMQTTNEEGAAGIGIVDTGFNAALQTARSSSLVPGTDANTKAEHIEKLANLAIKRLSDGKGEYEGAFIQADTRGVDTDPEGKVIYDHRTIRVVDHEPGRYVNAGPNSAGQDLVLKETRYWTAATKAAVGGGATATAATPTTPAGGV